MADEQDGPVTAVTDVTNSGKKGVRSGPSESGGIDDALAAIERQGAESRGGGQLVTPDRRLVHVVPAEKQLLVVSSDGSVRAVSPKAGQAQPSRSTFSAEGIRRYRNGEQVQLNDVIQRLIDLLEQYMWFPRDWLAPLVATWIAGTYLHSLFRHFGYLNIVSPTKGCGKTTLEMIVSKTSFNATDVMVNPELPRSFSSVTPTAARRFSTKQTTYGSIATIYKPSSTGASRKVRWSGDGVGDHFEGPYQLRRLLSEGDRWSERDSIDAAEPCFSYSASEKAYRGKASEIRPGASQAQRATSGAPGMIYTSPPFATQSASQDSTESRLALPFDGGVDDRLRDIFGPLFAIGAAADQESAEPTLIDHLRDAVHEQAELRTDDNREDERVVIVIRALSDEQEKRGGDSMVLTSQENSQVLSCCPGLEFLYDPRKATGFLRNKLDFKPDHVRPGGGANTVWGYKITRSALDDLRGRYGS